MTLSSPGIKDEPESPDVDPGRRWVAGCLGAIVVGPALSLAVAFVLLRAWSDCQAGWPAINELGMLFLTPIIAASLTLIFAVVAILFGRSHPRCAAAVAFLVAILVAYAWLAATLPSEARGLEPDHPGVCPGNVPPWWPSWLPI
jgi:hypothetical protein